MHRPIQWPHDPVEMVSIRPTTHLLLHPPPGFLRLLPIQLDDSFLYFNIAFWEHWVGTWPKDKYIAVLNEYTYTGVEERFLPRGPE